MFEISGDFFRVMFAGFVVVREDVNEPASKPAIQVRTPLARTPRIGCGDKAECSEIVGVFLTSQTKIGFSGDAAINSGNR